MSPSRDDQQNQNENIAWSIVRRLGMVVVLGLVFVLSATVTVFLLIRTGDTRVPAKESIIGKSEAEARQAVQKAGLRVSDVIKLPGDEGSAPDTVFRTDPPPNSSVKKETFVRLYVSTTGGQGRSQVGADELMVPDVSGKTVAEAQATIEQAGLKATVQRRGHPTIPANSIIETDPPAKTAVRKDSTVTIMVSSGPPRPRNTNAATNANVATNQNRPASPNRPANVNR